MGTSGLMESMTMPTAREWLQHKLLAVIPILLGLHAAMWEFVRLNARWKYGLATIAVVGAIGLLSHQHRDHPGMDVVNLQHRLFAVSVLVIAIGLALEEQGSIPLPLRRFLFPAGIMLLGVSNLRCTSSERRCSVTLDVLPTGRTKFWGDHLMSEVAVKVEGLYKRYRIGAVHGSQGIGGLLARGIRGLVHSSTEKSVGSEIWALRDVSFEIQKGEVFGVIGANGSGKSTLLKILSRVTQPTKGRAVLYGRFCGLLEVGTGFHPELTGRDNVYMSGAILGMKRREIERKFEEIIEFAEVADFIDTPVKHYSTGMYVRLGFSVLAHMDPDILIVDEVLAVGDVRFQKKCIGKMEAVGQHGRTVLLVSHDMSAIARLCKRAILLKQGQIVREGPAHEVVVTDYLSSGHVQPYCEWPDIQQAPGNEVVRLRAVRVKTESGSVGHAFDIRQSIAIELEFEVRKTGHVLVAGFGLYNEENLNIFIAYDRDPSWHKHQRPVGRYMSTAWIPANLLSEGFLTVNAAIITEDPFRLHCDVPRVVGFRVHENGTGPSARGDFTGRWPGAVRPLLKWTTQHTAPT